MRIWNPLPTTLAEVSDLWDWIHETRFVFLQTLAQNGWWQHKGVSNSASLYVLYTQTWVKKQLYMALTKHRWITFQILIKKFAIKINFLEEFCCYLLKNEPNKHSGSFKKSKRILIRIALGKVICIQLTHSNKK